MITSKDETILRNLERKEARKRYAVERMAAPGVKRTAGIYLPCYLLRILLGIPEKVGPKESGTYELEGYTYVLGTREGAQKRFKKDRTRPHRLYSICPACKTFVPAGRVHQHICK